jgi:hypothetical protein
MVYLCVFVDNPIMIEAIAPEWANMLVCQMWTATPGAYWSFLTAVLPGISPLFFFFFFKVNNLYSGA